MSTPEEIETRFWKAIKSDRTIMLGLDGKVPARPMTAILDEDAETGPMFIFTARQSALVEPLGASPTQASATFASKGHNIFATVHGELSIYDDRETIDRLWNPFVAAWYDGGKDDPDLVLLRFDAEKAVIWVDGSSVWAGLQIMLGVDPKKAYKNKVAEVDL